jgi:hypothetical protein
MICFARLVVRRHTLSQGSSKRVELVPALCWDSNYRINIADVEVRDHCGFVK